MLDKIPIYPGRVRRIPDQFSWVDGRLVRDHHLDRCSHAAMALYLFLVTVADAKGLSFYSDPSLRQRLSMDQNLLTQARAELVANQLIAFKSPLHQVLDLAPPPPGPSVKRNTAQDAPLSIGQILKRVLESDS
jgi:hypothetical protein